MRMLCDHGKEVQEGLSVPRVSSVLLVVELELDLIFYLIHKDLGQQDSHQLQRAKRNQAGIHYPLSQV